MADYGWLAYGITHGYVSSYQGAGTDSPHYAVDIGTPFHTPVTALFAGVVISQRTGIAWGTELFIQPDDSSLPQYYYYHLDQLYTHPGEHMSAGEVIGLSGGQNSGGSNPTTPQYSTGPHTHVGFFTKWVNTPDGTRPYGPDITPDIQALAKGQTPPIPSSDTQKSLTGGGNTITDSLAKLGEWVVTQFGISQAIIDSIAAINSQPFTVIGIAVIGIAGAVFLASWFLLNGGF